MCLLILFAYLFHVMDTALTLVNQQNFFLNNRVGMSKKQERKVENFGKFILCLKRGLFVQVNVIAFASPTPTLQRTCNYN